MIDGLVAKRYAEALFNVANEKNLLDKVEQDLKVAAEILNNTEDLMTFLRHPQVDSQKKKNLIDSSFKDSIAVISKNFLFQLIDNHRIEFIEDILRIYVKLANDVRGVLDVEAVTAVPLDDSENGKVIQSLSGKFGKQIRLTNVIDPSVIGGMIVKIGDRIYDGSVNKQLKVLKRSLTASRV